MGKNITIGILVIMLAITGIYAYQTNIENSNRLVYIENGNENSFLTLNNALEDMSEDLELITVSNDDTFICTKLAEITKTASHAQKSITALPISHNTALNATDFLSLCEDYCYTLMLSLINGGSLSETDKASLAQLSENCALLSEGTHTFAESRTGDFQWYNDDYEFITDDEEPSFLRMFSAFEKNYADFKEISYNGKYSSDVSVSDEGNENTQIYDYKLIESELNEKYKDSDNVQISYLNKDTAMTGKTYGYHTFEISDSENYMQLDYDMTNGKLIKARSSKSYEGSILSEEEIANKAKQYLEEMGLTSLSVIASSTDSNVTTLNYAYTKDDIIYYPNSLSIQVSAENGELVGFNASDYYKYSTDRTPHITTLTPEQAKANLSNELTVTDCRTVVISMNDTSERYAYEFAVQKNDSEYKITIDADTGKELTVTKAQ